MEGLPAILRLAWGALLASVNAAQHKQEASRLLVEAQRAGAFQTLRQVRAAAGGCAPGCGVGL